MAESNTKAYLEIFKVAADGGTTDVKVKLRRR